MMQSAVNLIGTRAFAAATRARAIWCEVGKRISSDTPGSQFVANGHPSALELYSANNAIAFSAESTGVSQNACTSKPED